MNTEHRARYEGTSGADTTNVEGTLARTAAQDSAVGKHHVLSDEMAYVASRAEKKPGTVD